MPDLRDPLRLADTPGLPPSLPPSLFEQTAIRIEPWRDEVIDALGHDPRSPYVERFWLSILGPSTTWLLRRVAAGFDRSPEGFELPLSETAREIGLGDKAGRHSPFVRALARACVFEMGRWTPDGTMLVRRRLPPLNRRQLARLPEPLQRAHDAWQQAQLGTSALEVARRRARALALTLTEMDPDVGAVEQRLTGWGLHPGVAREAARWAWDRHVQAAASTA